MGMFDLLAKRVKVMGILNVTPDSFSDGGRFTNIEQALNHALKMIEHGADIIDIGGESTRPGSNQVSLDEELERVIPIIEKLTARSDITISIDSSKPEVMSQAIAVGATFINDVNALQTSGAIQIAIASKATVCLMHKKGQPNTMQQSPQYDDVVLEIIHFLQGRINCCLEAGMNREQIFIDPGFGFGKSVPDNLRLLQRLDEMAQLQQPILVGLSRKSLLQKITNRDVNNRLAGSLGLLALAVLKGASIVRVHDVRETVDILQVIHATAVL